MKEKISTSEDFRTEIARESVSDTKFNSDSADELELNERLWDQYRNHKQPAHKVTTKKK